MQLGDWWHANRPPATYPRAFVHYLSGHPVSGGIAWIGVLCSGDFSYGSDWGGGYGLTQVYGTYPLQQWDQYASAHEMGHNVSARRTRTAMSRRSMDGLATARPVAPTGPGREPGVIGGGTIS